MSARHLIEIKAAADEALQERVTELKTQYDHDKMIAHENYNTLLGDALSKYELGLGKALEVFKETMSQDIDEAEPPLSNGPGLSSP